jgi:hypothetical protein
MVLDTESKLDLAFQFLRSAKLPLLVHAGCDEAANLNPLMCDLPLHGCTYDKLKPHSPNYARRLLILESHDQLRLQ